MTNKMKDIREILNQYNIPWKYGDKEEVEATIKLCPYCLSEINIKAIRCPHCTSKLDEE